MSILQGTNIEAAVDDCAKIFAAPVSEAFHRALHKNGIWRGATDPRKVLESDL